MGHRTILYRAYDKNHELLYIGISSQVFGRFDQHSQTSKWMYECEYALMEHFMTRRQALEAEKLAIQEEFPKYNQVHKKEKPDETRDLQEKTKL